MYQIIYNVARFATSRRWHPKQEEAGSRVEETKQAAQQEGDNLNNSILSSGEFEESYRGPIFLKFLSTLGLSGGSLVNRVVHHLVMDHPWEVMVEPIKRLSAAELRKLKEQYKLHKEMKSRHITDM